MLCRSSCHLSAFLLNRLLNALLSFPHQVGKELQPWKKCAGGEREEGSVKPPSSGMTKLARGWWMLRRDIGMFGVTAAGLCPEELITFLCVLNDCSFEAFVAMSVTFQERHEFQSGKETLVRAGSWREVLGSFGVFFFFNLFCFA